MNEKRLVYYALGVLTVVSIGAVTNQIAPLGPTSGVTLSDRLVALARKAGAQRTSLQPGRRDLPLRLSVHRRRDLARDPIGCLPHRVGC